MAQLTTKRSRRWRFERSWQTSFNSRYMNGKQGNRRNWSFSIGYQCSAMNVLHTKLRAERDFRRSRGRVVRTLRAWKRLRPRRFPWQRRLCPRRACPTTCPSRNEDASKPGVRQCFNTCIHCVVLSQLHTHYDAMLECTMTKRLNRRNIHSTWIKIPDQISF